MLNCSRTRVRIASIVLVSLCLLCLLCSTAGANPPGAQAPTSKPERRGDSAFALEMFVGLLALGATFATVRAMAKDSEGGGPVVLGILAGQVGTTTGVHLGGIIAERRGSWWAAYFGSWVGTLVGFGAGAALVGVGVDGKVPVLGTYFVIQTGFTALFYNRGRQSPGRVGKKRRVPMPMLGRTRDGRTLYGLGMGGSF